MMTYTVTLTLVLSGEPPNGEEASAALEQVRRRRAYQRELMRTLRAEKANGGSEAHREAQA